MLTEEQRRFIAEAAQYFENPSLAVRISDKVGGLIESGVDKLPVEARNKLTQATSAALQVSLRGALQTIESFQPEVDFAEASEVVRTDGITHKFMTTAMGALSGMFGGAALAIELPLTTTVMLRSIARTAAQYGESLSDREVQLQCLSVFALGSPGSSSDDAAESGYFATRIALDRAIREAARFAARVSAQEFADAIAKGTAPVLVRLISSVAARYETAVLQKLVLQAAPIAGAVAGGGLNWVFTDHINQCAKYHFGMRHLERLHGGAVKDEYDRARTELTATIVNDGTGSSAGAGTDARTDARTDG